MGDCQAHRVHRPGESDLIWRIVPRGADHYRRTGGHERLFADGERHVAAREHLRTGHHHQMVMVNPAVGQPAQDCLNRHRRRA